MNREMLKEAIAEAKTIKETAIANAKAALTEAFTPQLTAMFAEQLNEEEEEGGVKENYDGVDEGDFSLEEILAELEAANEGDSELKTEDMYDENLDENLMLEDMSDEEIEELVTSVIDDMIASGKLMAGEESEEEEMDMDDMEDMDIDIDMDVEDEESEEEIEDDEDIEIDEILAEILGEEIEEGLGDIAGKISTALGKAFGSSSNFVEAEKAFFEQPDVVQLLNKLDQAKKANETSEVYETKEELLNKAKSFAARRAKEFGIEGMNDIGVLTKSLRYAYEKYDEDPKLVGIQKIATGASAGRSNPGTRTNEVELKEAYSTIEALRSELNEVNLLNAKLLYTNKIFKAKNLTESEKIKVLNTFDKAETVKEVKLVFETLTESLKTSTVKKNPIKESLGSASKTVTTAAPKQPIIEVNDAFARMQRLAGIKK